MYNKFFKFYKNYFKNIYTNNNFYLIYNIR